MSKALTVELTAEELETICFGLVYAFENLDGDMSMGAEELEELDRLNKVKERFMSLLKRG